MKKYFLILIIVFTALQVNGQDKRNYNYRENLNVIKINPLSLVLSNISLSYERFITYNMSLQLQAGYWAGFKIKNTEWSGISFTPEFRYYLTEQRRPSGLYGAVFGRYQQIRGSLKSSESEVKISRTGGGIAVGYQMLLGNRVAWDIFIGPQYLVYSMDKIGNANIDYGKFIGNMGVRMGTTLGVAF